MAIRQRAVAVAHGGIDHGSFYNTLSVHNILGIDETRLTPLHVAIKRDDLEMVELLVEKGEYFIGNDDGVTPTHYAVMRNRPKIVKFLYPYNFHKNLDINQFNTLLHLAIIHGNLNIAELLLDMGENIEARNYQGWTPLHRAVLNGNREMIRLLLSRGADMNAVDIYNRKPIDMTRDLKIRDILEKWQPLLEIKEPDMG